MSELLKTAGIATYPSLTRHFLPSYRSGPGGTVCSPYLDPTGPPKGVGGGDGYHV